MKSVTIYTDGACRGNPGPGGWGAVLQYGTNERLMSGSDPQTTNNRMELMAAIESLTVLREPCAVTLYTDSTYVRQGITQWIAAWRARGWKTSDNKPVKNVDLWERLDAQSRRHHIEWRWVKGHSGNLGNERADQLACAAADEHMPERGR